jgi:hypothetical protein
MKQLYFKATIRPLFPGHVLFLFGYKNFRLKVVF